MTLGQLVILGYAVLMILGGLVGYRLKMSKISLISGLASGGVLLVALGWSFADLTAGSWIAVAVSVILSLVFFIRVKKSKKIMPAGMLLVISIAAFAALLYTVIVGTPE